MYKIVLLFSLFMMFSCSKIEKRINILDVESIRETTSFIEVVDSVYFIMPKLISEHPIGSIDKVIKHSNGIYILDKLTRKLFSYSSTGNLLSVLNNRGKGPFEYLDISDFCFNDDTIYTLLDRRKIQVYDKNLNFIRDVKNNVWASKIQKTKKWIWLNSFYDQSNNSPYGIFKLDNSGKVIGKYLKIPKNSNKITHDPQLNFVNYNDTIYTIQPLDNKIYSIYNDVVNSDYIIEHRHLLSDYSNPINYNEVFRPEVLSILNNGFMLIYYTKNTLEMIINKEYSCRYVYPKKISFSLLKSRSGLFSPAFCVGADDEFIISMIPPIITLSCKENDNMVKGLSNSFNELVTKSDENSNPIIAIWKLKRD